MLLCDPLAPLSYIWLPYGLHHYGAQLDHSMFNNFCSRPHVGLLNHSWQIVENVPTRNIFWNINVDPHWEISGSTQALMECMVIDYNYISLVSRCIYNQYNPLLLIPCEGSSNLRSVGDNTK